MKYTKINLDQWDRGELFQFYMEHMRIVMSSDCRRGRDPAHPLHPAVRSEFLWRYGLDGVQGSQRPR